MSFHEKKKNADKTSLKDNTATSYVRSSELVEFRRGVNDKDYSKTHCAHQHTLLYVQEQFRQQAKDTLHSKSDDGRYKVFLFVFGRSNTHTHGHV